MTLRISRRDFVTHATMAAAMTRASLLQSAAAQPATRVRFAVPPGACDCHTHVFGDPRRFPFAPARTYTPEPASVDDMRRLHRALHTSRVVIVQPSVYGTDNRCTLDAIRQLAPHARGIAVIDEQTPDSALDDMHGGGIRGIRINLATVGQNDPEVARRRFDAAVERIRGRGWHIQMYAQLPVIAALHAEVASASIPVVFDHFGGAQGRGGVTQPGFDVLLDLVRAGRAYVKLSAPYRGSTNPPDYADMAPLATALIAAHAGRMLWGTDWPHPDTTPGRPASEVSPLRQIDDGRVFNQLERWAPDPHIRKTILVDTHAALYGFPGSLFRKAAAHSV